MEYIGFFNLFGLAAMTILDYSDGTNASRCTDTIVSKPLDLTASGYPTVL